MCCAISEPAALALGRHVNFFLPVSGFSVQMHDAGSLQLTSCLFLVSAACRTQNTSSAARSSLLVAFSNLPVVLIFFVFVSHTGSYVSPKAIAGCQFTSTCSSSQPSLLCLELLLIFFPRYYAMRDSLSDSFDMVLTEVARDNLRSLKVCFGRTLTTLSSYRCRQNGPKSKPVVF